jgi:hypothetical protein
MTNGMSHQFLVFRHRGNHESLPTKRLILISTGGVRIMTPAVLALQQHHGHSTAQEVVKSVETPITSENVGCVWCMRAAATCAPAGTGQHAYTRVYVREWTPVTWLLNTHATSSSAAQKSLYTYHTSIDVLVHVVGGCS